jgi:hypothetical protein
MNPNMGQYFPGKLQAIAIIQTAVGAIEILISFAWAFYVFFVGIATLGVGFLFFPIPLIFLTVGVLSLISGIKGLQRNPGYGLTMSVSISQMVLILGCDFLSFGAGLAGVILMTQPEVKGYFGK